MQPSVRYCSTMLLKHADVRRRFAWQGKVGNAPMHENGKASYDWWIAFLMKRTRQILKRRK